MVRVKVIYGSLRLAAAPVLTQHLPHVLDRLSTRDQREVTVEARAAAAALAPPEVERVVMEEVGERAMPLLGLAK